MVNLLNIGGTEMKEKVMGIMQRFSKVYLAIGNCVKRQLILYATCHHYLLMN
jgi:hypothetical protein